MSLSELGKQIDVLDGDITELDNHISRLQEQRLKKVKEYNKKLSELKKAFDVKPTLTEVVKQFPKSV